MDVENGWERLTFFKFSAPISPNPVAKNPGETAQTFTPSSFRIRFHSLINMFKPVLADRYDVIGFQLDSFGHPFAGLALILCKAGWSNFSVSISALVPDVMNINLGSLDFNSKGMAPVVRTCVPETLVSQLALKASLIVILDWASWPSKLAPPLLMRTSKRLYLEVMVERAVEMLSSEDKSSWRTERVDWVGEVGVRDWTVLMASSPLATERLPITIS